MPLILRARPKGCAHPLDLLEKRQTPASPAPATAVTDMSSRASRRLAGGRDRGAPEEGTGTGTGTGGLRQPLLPRAGGGGGADGEAGRAAWLRDLEAGPPPAADSDSHSHSHSHSGPALPLRRRPYRLRTVAVSLLDLGLAASLSLALDGRGAFLPGPGGYGLTGSVADVAWLAVLRAAVLVGQALACRSSRSAKGAGYVCLLSFLALGTKACACAAASAGRWRTEPLFAAVVVLGALFSALEGVLEGLVCHFGSDVPSTGPTAEEAAEGIAVGGAKSIGLAELATIMRPYFWPEGLLNRFCVMMTWTFLISSKAANILAPMFIAKATDALAGEDPARAVTLLIAGYASLLFANKAFKELQSLSYIRVKLIASVQLKESIFAHLLTLSMDWHQRKSMGAVLTAMARGINASNMVVQYLFLYLLPTLVEAMVVSAVFVGAFGAPLLGACAVSGAVLYIAVTIELTIWRMDFRKRMNKADNDASNKATDSLLNFETVKYFTAERHEVQRYRESIDAYQDQAYRIQGSLSLLNATQQVVLNSTLIGAMLVAANEYRVGNFTIGQFIAVNVYVQQLFAPLNYLGSIYGMVVGSYIDLSNLCNLLAETPDVCDREGARTLTAPAAPGGTTEPLGIEFRDVKFAYPSRRERQILKGISFSVPPGSTTAIVGETGSGKSTLTRLLFRFFEADGGEVLVGGQNVMDITQTSLREQLGVVPQDHTLFNDTLEYNVKYGARDKGAAEVRAAADAAQLGDFIDELPDGMDTVVGERGQQLSGGQKQRVAIARALLKDPPIVVLDEATSSLDSRTEEQIQAALDSLRGGRTMVVIAHRLSTVQNADQILVMSDGEIIERGTHETLLAKGNWHERCYSSLWDRQRKNK